MADSSKDEILKYLATHGVENKDAAEEALVRAAKRAALKDQKTKPDRNYTETSDRKTIDLHGKRREQAAIILRNTVQVCRERNITRLLIIHGKGNRSHPEDGPVLREMVHTLLRNEFAAFVEDFTSAMPRDGGDGATIVRFDFQRDI